MQDNETQQFIMSILERANTGIHTNFQYIENFDQYQLCGKQYKYLKVLLKVLHRTEKQILKEYCRTVTLGISDINQLLSYRQLITVIMYYDKEMDTATKMLEDYENYLRAGNFLRALLGETRIVSILPEHWED